MRPRNFRPFSSSVSMLMRRHNSRVAHFLFQAWLLVMVQAVMPHMVLCVKAGAPANLEFALPGMHCGCASTLLPVGEEDLRRIAREDGPCSDHPFITDFDSTGASATIPARYESRPGTTPCGERTSNPTAFRILRSDSSQKWFPPFSPPSCGSQRC